MKQLIKWSRANWLVWVIVIAYLLLAVTRTHVASTAALVALTTFRDLIVTLVVVFLIVGLFQVWVSEDFIVRHLGQDSGLKGLAFGAGIGTVIHGPLVGVFPLLKTLLGKGARLGVVIAIVSTWAIKLPMIPLEIRLFGWKFTLLREGLLFASAFIMAPVMELALGKDWALPKAVDAVEPLATAPAATVQCTEPPEAAGDCA